MIAEISPSFTTPEETQTGTFVAAPQRWRTIEHPVTRRRTPRRRSGTRAPVEATRRQRRGATAGCDSSHHRG